MPRYCFTYAVIAAIFLAVPALADVSLPSIFGDHMVLQQEAKLPVWGTAAPGEKVTVTVGDHTATTTANAQGAWRVELAPFPAGTPAVTMTVAGNSTLTFTDVLIGDVWLASGQSNMEYQLAGAANGQQESRQAKDPQLRLFFVAKNSSLHPLPDVTSPFNWRPWTGQRFNESDGDRRGTWLVCEPHAAGDFSAIAYFFGKELRAHLQRPIGLIGSYWGGSMAEAWMSLSGLQQAPAFTTYLDAYQQHLAAESTAKPEYEKAHAAYLAELKRYEDQVQEAIGKFQIAQKAWVEADKAAKAAGQPSPAAPKLALPSKPKAPASTDGAQLGPANLYHAMLAPLIPFAIKGVIWYQGESNTREKALEYRLLFPRLIADWREKWGQGDFPFLYVQISHFPYANDQSSALIREAQLQALAVPHTGMAVTVDIPCDDAGHPRDKVDPGLRLALAARQVAYGEDIVASGPLYKSMQTDGNAIRIHFTSIGSGLVIGQSPYQPPTAFGKPLAPLPTDRLVGFTITGDDRKFVPANAVIDEDTILVSSPDVPKPCAVRFAWGDTVTCNLYNREKLPASPFRTDNWNIFTYAKLVPGIVPPTFKPEYFLQEKAK